MGPWKVKKRSPASGVVTETLADDWNKALELRDEFIAKGFEAWIEDVDGRRVG